MLRCSSPPERGLRRASFRTSPNNEGLTAAETGGRSAVAAFPHLWTVLWTGKSAGEAFALVVSEERLWNSCVGVLRTRVPESAWQSCFGVARPIALEGSCLVLSVPSVLARQRIEARYRDVLRATLEEVGGASYDVRLEVSPDARADTDEDDDTDDIEDEFKPAAVAKPPAAAQERGPDDLPVNPRYTFEAFVIGASNRFAHAAALSAAEGHRHPRGPPPQSLRVGPDHRCPAA